MKKLAVAVIILIILIGGAVKLAEILEERVD